MAHNILTMHHAKDHAVLPQGWDTLEGLGDQAFLKWVARSQLYSGDLLEPAALQDLTLWMEAAPASERRDMMALLRDLHASVNPTGSAPAFLLRFFSSGPLLSHYLNLIMSSNCFFAANV